MDYPELQMTGDNILVLPSDRENISDGGIVIAGDGPPPDSGTVVAVGSGMLTSGSGTRIPSEVAPGDRVIFDSYSVAEVIIERVKYLLMREVAVRIILPAATQPQSSAAALEHHYSKELV